MFSLLLSVIYIAFISLGLPDSLLGSAWPVMFGELGVSVSYAGIISMIISFGTIVSSLLSDKITRRLGAGTVTAASMALTGLALLGFSLSRSFVFLCILAIPYGLGAGAIDAALNNYVALHYSSRHMSWLHCFWGVGVSISPYIMGYAIGAGHGWRTGYGAVSMIQLVLTVLIAFSLPLWRKKTATDPSDENYEAPITIREAVKIRGVKPILLAFFAYCAFESTAGLWASTYLVEYKGIDVEIAARFASLFYLGITFGRFLCGFVADKLGDKALIRIGSATMLVGVILIMFPSHQTVFALAGLVIAGLGAAPVYPSVIHSTPGHFGKENSHAIVGIQMASAYTGTTLMPPLFGLIAQHVSVALYPFYLVLFVALTFVMTEVVNKTTHNKI